MQVERSLRGLLLKLSGGRVSNARATCLYLGNNIEKSVLIPHMTTVRHLTGVKDLSDIDGLTYH